MVAWSVVLVVVLLAALGAVATTIVTTRTPTAEGVWPPQQARSWWKKYGAATITLITGIVTAAVSAFLTGLFTPAESADCASQITQVVQVVSSHPDLWIPIAADNEGEKECHLNEVAARVISSK